MCGRVILKCTTWFREHGCSMNVAFAAAENVEEGREDQEMK
jgi:hypothetical protein